MPPTENLNNYARLVLIIVNCGTLLTKKLFETLVKKLFPDDTISNFLEKNKQEICDADIGKHYKRILFPPNGHINIHKWDLTIFCFLLQLKMCKITGINKKDIEKLRAMRNDIYHLPVASKSASEFQNDLGEIFKKEFNEMVENLKEVKEDNIVLEELVKICREMAKREDWLEQMAEKQEQILHGISEFQREQKCQSCQIGELLVRLDTISSQLPPGQQVNQVAELKIFLKNLPQAIDETLSEYLARQFNAKLNGQSCDMVEPFTAQDRENLKKAVQKTIESLLKHHFHLETVENKCLLFRIRCITLPSFIKFIRDCRNGSIVEQLQDLLIAVRSVEGCENVEFSPDVPEDKLIATIRELVMTLEDIVRTGQLQSYENPNIVARPLYLSTETDFGDRVLDEAQPPNSFANSGQQNANVTPKTAKSFKESQKKEPTDRSNQQGKVDHRSDSDSSDDEDNDDEYPSPATRVSNAKPAHFLLDSAKQKRDRKYADKSMRKHLHDPHQFSDTDSDDDDNDNNRPNASSSVKARKHLNNTGSATAESNTISEDLNFLQQSKTNMALEIAVLSEKKQQLEEDIRQQQTKFEETNYVCGSGNTTFI